jgi:tetrahydromethanopterin S-methyltransferase subunit C
MDVFILNPLLVATGLALATAVVHSLAVGATIRFVRHERSLGHARGFWSITAIVAAGVTLMLVAHLAEIALWALAFMICGQFPAFGSAFYHSAENYTTLGYGDVIMSPAWRLLGPVEAADGMLMFGVSTALIFTVIHRMVQARFPDLRD